MPVMPYISSAKMTVAVARLTLAPWALRRYEIERML